MKGVLFMMKIKTVLSMLLLMVIHNASAQNIDYDMVGVYLPVEYITSLERTKHNPASWAFNRERYYHAVYIVDGYYITASGRYDGLEPVYLWDLLNFKFEAVEGDIFLTDHKNNRFRKLPGDLYAHEDLHKIIGNFIGGIVLDELIKSGAVILENDLVTFPALDHKTFRIEWQAFDPRQEKHLSFEGVADHSHLFLEIRPNEYVFYGYDYFINDIVWSIRVDETDVSPALGNRE
jgi:hypothetical protein